MDRKNIALCWERSNEKLDGRFAGSRVSLDGPSDVKSSIKDVDQDSSVAGIVINLRDSLTKHIFHQPTHETLLSLFY